MRDKPPGWGSDLPSAFLDDVTNNQFATFFNKPAEYQTLAEIDACFLRIAQHLDNSKGITEALLLLRSHSAFRAACGASVSGQAVGH